MAKQDLKGVARRLLAKIFQRDPSPPILVSLPGWGVERTPEEQRKIEAEEAKKRPRGNVPTAYYNGTAIEANRRPASARRPGGDFSRVNEPQASKIERAVQARYKTEKCQVGARMAFDDAGALYEKAYEALQNAKDDYHARTDRLTSDPRPAPPEAASHLNQKMADAHAAFEYAKAEIAADLKDALISLDYEDAQAVTRDQKRIGYVPDRTGKFNRAAAPAPAPAEAGPGSNEAPPPPLDLTLHFLMAAIDIPEIIEDEAALQERLGYVRQPDRIVPAFEQDVDPDI